MKAPNPTFLHKAENIRGKRRLLTLSLLAILSFIVLVVVFVVSVASSQQEYSELYPDLVGRATDTTTTIEVPTGTKKTEESTTDTSVSETETTTELAPSTVNPDASSSTESTQDMSKTDPEVLELENYHFATPKAQVISHQKRAVLLDKMKNDIEQYIKKVRKMRICFQYISLRTGESLGLKELDPIVPSGSYALPINIIASEMSASGQLDPNEIITYSGHKSVNGSYITSKYNTGKQISVGFLEYLSVAKSDSVALELLLSKMSGLEQVLPRINAISSFQSFDKEIYYINYEGVDSKGTGRSTCYDMGNYISYLYKSYVKNPSTYQALINSLANSDVESPLASAFAPDTKILHMYGRNNDLKGYTEVAIIDTYEPIAVCIYVESANKNDVATAFSTIGKYVNEYISACY